MAKKILFTLFSIFLIVQSINAVGAISDMDVDSWIVNLLLAIMINLFVTGVFAFTGFVYPTERLLPEAYYRISNILFQKSTYKILKVDVFRKFLLATFWKKKEMQKTHFDGTRSGIANLIVQSKKSEFGHLIPFVILLSLSIYWNILGKSVIAVLTQVINILFNFYPIMLQRQHRMRIQLIRERQRRKMK